MLAVFPWTSSWARWACFQRRSAFLRGLPHRLLQRLGELREGRQPAEADGAPHGHDDDRVNQQYFGGRQVVTASRATAAATGQGHAKPRDAVRYTAARRARRDAGAGTPGDADAAQILDKYLQAIGVRIGPRSSPATSAKGTYSGYGPEGFPRPVEIYAKAPNQRAVIVRDKEAGDNTTAFNGTAGWVSSAIQAHDVMELHGAEFDSARADAD